MKRFFAMLMTGMAVTLSVTACGIKVVDNGTETVIYDDSENTEQEGEEKASDETKTEEAKTEVTEEDTDDEENYETGDASLDDPGNQDEIGDKELLVISFGTSFNDSRRLTIGAIEGDLKETFPDYSVRRAFTSNIIIDHINKRDGILIDDVDGALKRAVDNGVKELVVQPTHLMDGYEYHDLVEEVSEYAGSFESVRFGEPLLTSDEDFKAVEKAITDWTKEYDDGETAIVFMGHGTEADSNSVYGKMQDMLTEDGYKNYFLGTVEAEPALEDVIASVKAGEYKRVVLEPLMVVAGDHANNDMAGDEDGSWKKEFEKAGYEVECLLRGLGENEDIRKLYAEHAKAAMEVGEELKESKAGDTKEIKAEDLKDGSYEIDVDSSSDMFNIEKCSLTVKDGKMTAAMTMGGKGYQYVFMGTADEAQKASEKDYTGFEEKDDKHIFTVPVEALNKEMDCAAFSKKKETWYDRTLVFKSDKLPRNAFKEAEAENDSTEIRDGEYESKVELKGGTGRASVESPAKVTVKNGMASATIVWSSPNYDYMLVNGEKYLPVNKDGNSTFTIPVEAFDKEFTVIADTTAMSKPHEVEYTLKFEAVK